MVEEASHNHVVLFDGVCNLCNGFVQFLIKRDKQAMLRFASLQSEYGQRRMNHGPADLREADSVVFIQNGNYFVRSEAALRILIRLGGIWRLAYIGFIFPSFIRDAVYNWVARNRYGWFGRKDQCMVPSPEWSKWFIE